MKTVLLIFLIWIPLDDSGVATVSSDYVKHNYNTEAECNAAKDGETRVYWTSKPDHRMIGTKQCTDGSIPASVTIGTIAVTVETLATVPSGG